MRASARNDLAQRDTRAITAEARPADSNRIPACDLLIVRAKVLETARWPV
jgi:hypothetical protein